MKTPPPTNRQPLPVELLISADERREKFPNSSRAKCIKQIASSIGEGGFREFLRQPQPAFEDRTGAEILERQPEELLRRLHELDRPDLDDIDDAVEAASNPILDHIPQRASNRKAKGVLAILDQINSQNSNRRFTH